MEVIKTERFSARIQSKESEKMLQAGTAVGSLNGRTVTFPVAFGVAPRVVATPMTGTVLWFRARAPSTTNFVLAGSPTAKVFQWMAWGSV